ncbi:MAG: VOC family protein [Candidatus Sericytochromatia bacterium]|nr:VOC family protein [Candidatus Tanganyikabacteria bacterium]
MLLGLRTAIYQVDDIAAAKAWYSRVTGIEPYFDQPFYVGFNVGGFELGLQPEEAPGGGIIGNAYWGVPDARAAFARLLELGASSCDEIADVGEGILVGSVIDPFGNRLGIIENPHFKLPPGTP